MKARESVGGLRMRLGFCLYGNRQGKKKEEKENRKEKSDLLSCNSTDFPLGRRHKLEYAFERTY